MVRSQPARSARLPWRAASEATARAAAGSTAALLRLAEAATLASAAGVRSVLDLTRPSTTSPTTGEAHGTRSVAAGSTEEPSVLTMLENRIRKLEGQSPAPGDNTHEGPRSAAPPRKD